MLQAMPKTNTEKQPQKKNDHYNLKSKGVPLTLGEAQEKMRLFLRKGDPPTTPKQKTHNKSGKTTMDKSTSMSNKLQNTPLENTNISPTPNTSVILPPLDYNIVDDMKKTWKNISLLELAKI